MRQIIMVQHTQSLHHTNGMVGSWTDWDLTDEGICQAKTIAKKLSLEISKEKWVLYSSDLLRARHTADIIAWELGIKPILRHELRERNLGAAVGKSVEWLRANIENKEVTIDDRCFRDAESVRDVWGRLVPFFEQINLLSEENAIIVSHGETLGIFAAMWARMKPEALESFSFRGKAGGVTFMKKDSGGKRTIERFSDMSYIKQ
ncbi:MAG: histidine phosphatase family protein [Clostridiaceae bacterium]|nr:histidine phosphatase family protein [Clostridiaceae bacterium]